MILKIHAIMKQVCTSGGSHLRPPKFKWITQPIRNAIIVVGCLMQMFVANAQNNSNDTYRLSGKITSAAEGEALPGVNVLVRGTQTGTVTDLDGNYSISVSSDDVILVSFIGS
jgi:hypothetical protein